MKSILLLPVSFGLLFLGLIILRSKGISPKGAPKRETRPGTQTTMEIRSGAFGDGQTIPKKYTCDGNPPAGGMNPPLEISNVPSEAQSLVLIVQDDDAPVPGGWTHWTVFNIDPATTAIAENSAPAGAVQGATGFGKPGYGGPCPPSGTHHYEFRLYALDTMLTSDGKAKKTDIEHAMEGHIVAHCTLVGLYKRT